MAVLFFDLNKMLNDKILLVTSFVDGSVLKLLGGTRGKWLLWPVSQRLCV